MANEATIVELRGNNGDIMDLTVSGATGISGGTVIKIESARVGSASTGTGDKVWGISASEKDGTSTTETNLGVYTNVVADMYKAAGGANVLIRDYVSTSGANLFKKATDAEISGGKILGIAMEENAGSGQSEVFVHPM